MANTVSFWSPDLCAEPVEGQSRVRCRELGLAVPFDFKEPDRDPHRELVRPDRGQVHDALEPLGAKIRALPSVWRRAGTQVDVLDRGKRDEIDATTGERAEAAIGRLPVHEGISSLAGVARRAARVVVGDLEQATRRNRRGLAGS